MCANDHDVQKCVDWVREGANRSPCGPAATVSRLLDNDRSVDRRLGHEQGYSRPRRGVAHIQAAPTNQDMAKACTTPDLRCCLRADARQWASPAPLGGGWGFAATKSGLTCDSLINTDIPRDGRRPQRTVGEGQRRW